jgi:hypothetical protein
LENFEQFILEVSKEEFLEVGRLQRDLPEKAMLKFQLAHGGGIMNSLTEHIGDLTHRMSDPNTFGSAGYEYVKDKVMKCHNWLTNPYGLEREFEENIVNNAKYLKVPEEEFRQKMYKLLNDYAEEHAKLPVYNKAQKLARDAAYWTGKRDFLRATICLDNLKKHLGSVEDWVKFAHEDVSI